MVRQQAEVGVDVVSDGEFGKGISWSQYVIERVSGFERRPFNPATGNPFTKGADRERFPDFYQELDAKDHVETITDTVAVAPIKYTGQGLLQQDIDNFKAALKKVKVVEGFLPVAAPASVIPDRKNHRRHRTRVPPPPPRRAGSGSGQLAAAAERPSSACACVARPPLRGNESAPVFHRSFIDGR